MKHLHPITAVPALALDDFWWNVRLIVEPIFSSLMYLIQVISTATANKETTDQS